MQQLLGRATYRGVLKTQDVKLRRDLRDMSFIFLALTAAVIVIAVAFFYLWCRLTVVNTGYDLSMLHASRSSLIDTNKRLRLQVSELRSPARIEREAKLIGLDYPSVTQVVRIK